VKFKRSVLDKLRKLEDLSHAAAARRLKLHRETVRRYREFLAQEAKGISGTESGGKRQIPPPVSADSPPVSTGDPPPVSGGDFYARKVARALRAGAALDELLEEVPLDVLEQLVPRLGKLSGMVEVSRLKERMDCVEKVLSETLAAIDSLSNVALGSGDQELETDRFLDALAHARKFGKGWKK